MTVWNIKNPTNEKRRPNLHIRSFRSVFVIALLLLTTDHLPAPVSELPESLKLKRTFFTLKGYAVDTFVNEKKLPPELDPNFGGYAPVIGTPPLNELMGLVKKFGHVLSDNDAKPAYLTSGFESENMTPEMQRREAAIKKITESQLKKIARTPILPAAGGYPPPTMGFIASKFPANFFADHDWYTEGYQLDELLAKGAKRVSRDRVEIPMSLYDSGITGSGSIALIRYATKGDIEILRRVSAGSEFEDDPYKALIRFYADVCHSGMPERFLRITVAYEECGSSTGVTIEPPFLQVRVLVLENITDKPIEIGQFHFRLFDPGRGLLAVRTRAENERVLASLTAESQSWYAPHVLKPGEKIIIPLELLFKPSGRSNYHDASAETTQSTRRAWANKLRADRELQTVAIMYEGKDAQRPLESNDLQRPKSAPLVVMPKQKFIDALLREPVSPLEKDEFICGPSIALDALEVDGRKYAVEPFDPINVAYFGAADIGSCPFVYYLRSSDNIWIKAGTILTGRSSKLREGTTVLEINNFDGMIRVAEQEDETSYVDQLFIRGTSSTGEKITVPPADGLLAHRDHRYLVLTKGKSAEVRFRIPEGMRHDRVEVVASGYFEATSGNKSR